MDQAAFEDVLTRAAERSVKRREVAYKIDDVIEAASELGISAEDARAAYGEHLSAKQLETQQVGARSARRTVLWMLAGSALTVLLFGGAAAWVALNSGQGAGVGGRWQTDHGTLFLDVAGDRVVGSYRYAGSDNGLIEGRLDPAAADGRQVLRFSWRESRANGKVATGDGEFTFEPQARSFTGRRRNEGQMIYPETWAGHR